MDGADHGTQDNRTGDRAGIRGRILTVGLIAGAAALIAALAFTLVSVHSNARDELGRNFTARAQFTASTTTGLISAGFAQERQIAANLLRGSPAQVAGELRRFQREAPATRQLIVYDAAGEVLAAQPGQGPLRRLLSLTQGAARAAALGRREAVSDLIAAGPARGLITAAVSYPAAGATRLLLTASNTDALRSYIEGYLRAGLSPTRRARAYLLDGDGSVIASSGSDAPGTPLRDRALLAAIAKRPSGQVGPTQYALVPVGAGTRWRIVETAPRDALYAPVAGDYTTAWLLLAALVATIGLTGLAAVRAARRSAQLARTRERARAAERLAHNRLHDPLTGLPNRALFLDRAEHALAAQRRSGESLAIMFFDVDRFKRINDSLGHRLGDRVLATVAYRVESALRPTDTVSRFGGDEFTVLSPGVDARDALELARRIEDAIEQPLRLIDQRTIHVSTSIGVALHAAEDAPADAETLIGRADTAMYAAKATPGTQIQLYDTERDRDGVGQLDAELGLRAAIENDELTLRYEPLVELATGRTRGVEALVGWQHPEQGLLAPRDLIPLAEQSGLIGLLGEWVLRQSCAELAAWRDAELVADGFLLAVNVSARQLSDPGLAETFRRILAETGVAAASVSLEVADSAVMLAPERAIAAFDELHALGFALALDDFGTGGTSLAQVANLPVSELKLDRSFVAELEHERDAAIVETIATLAASLGFTAVAAGVETPAQAERLRQLGYTTAQGPLFGSPATAEQARERLRHDLAAAAAR